MLLPLFTIWKAQLKRDELELKERYADFLSDTGLFSILTLSYNNVLKFTC